MRNLTSGPSSTQTDPITFRRILTRAIILPLVLLALMTGLFLWQVRRLLDTVGWVEHTDLVIARAYNSQKLLLDMETGFRGYMISGLPEFLEPYNTASQEIGPAISDLRQLVSDNPAQTQKLDDVRLGYTQWEQYASEVIAARAKGGEYQARVSGGEGKRIMDGLRAQSASFINTEETLRNERTQAVRRATMLAVSSGLAAGLLLGVILVAFIRRQMIGASESYRKALASEQQQREWLGTTLTSIGDAVIASDRAGYISLMNGVAESVTGWTNAEAAGVPLQDVFKIINEDTRATVESPVVKVLREGQIVGLANHTILITKDGREIPIDDSGAPIKDAEGKTTGVVLVFRDITDRKRTEQELEQLLRRESVLRAQAETANRLKDEFFSNASHELRTPLSAIVGWVRLLRRGNLDEATKASALETIERNANAQTKLIDDLMDISRIVTGKLNVDMRPVEAAPIVSAAVNSLRPSAGAKGITIDMTVRGESWPVLADINRLQQVVWNLLSNAIKFTPKGGEVEVKLERVDSQLEISVRDTGEGIDPKFLPFVFDRFRQADATETRKHGGLGLGLSIVRNLVELQGGTVNAFSEGLNKGAVFTVRLPLLGLLDHSQNPPVPLSKEKGRGPGKPFIECPPKLAGVRVLVVDDDRDTREMLLAVLSQCEAEVVSVSSMDQALTEIERQKPDVLVSDIGMPEQDGYELIRKVRSMEAKEGSRRVAALALTAYAKSEDRVRALTAGYHVHLSKPVDPEEFALMVSSLLGRRNQ